MEIRQATPEDAEIALAFFIKLQEERLPTILRHEKIPTLEEEKKFLEGMSGEGGAAFFCLVENRIVGMVGANRNKHPQLRHRCEFGIGILKGYRNQGIGGRLVERLIHWAGENNLQRLELAVFENNPDAMRFYKRWGFTVEGRKSRAVQVDERFLDLIEMARELPPVHKGA
jgi:RimJ/RimL family protein N-acetyltransferase